ncbi:hypothetical protein A3C23_00040 [Candidatus Roizmanbacteria bacterium RIFCSPHIGHO2_02_FULL_37_13b]|uniref:Type II secretion system protein GspG C-terminal domain-containing protein n=1 Tax=Candidatus Roizmanbacteria bacterium RIFCSPLOWO2_02_FULL_36_11 TaxID=1802071 RepID=A0A1F7JHK7_9BACT|nr:MAG: hypothetical protein A3C23_00040 [Candidatus Roizmanbacteria bacterium RIFCSPHIGHO2_02_FULL_37_13b]OGK55091.1 MAG: hypothetical protein A3H78_03855 [Candidatus Roizmanbacteria bacterium RIFCSPLOWO2_02_FULL_36_11]
MPTNIHKSHYIFLLLITILALTALSGGFLLAGSPAESRAINYDKKRIDDVYSLRRSIEDYYETNKSLPATLSDLKQREDIVDPDTKLPYEYRTSSQITYELCATFTTDLSKIETYYLTSEEKKQINKGRSCVTFSIPTYLIPTPASSIGDIIY